MATSSRPPKRQVYMNMAGELSKLSTCPRRSVGALITDWSGKSVSFGYNGSPSGMEHCIDVGCVMVEGHCSSAVHAEINSILNGNKDRMNRGTIYIYGGSPCYRCSQSIITVDISTVYYWQKDGQQFSEDQEKGKDMLEESSTTIIRLYTEENETKTETYR